MSRRVVAAVVAVLAVVTGCSTQSSGLSAAAEKVLVPKVQQVRNAAAGGNYAHLVARVAQLKALVVKERDAGEVSASRASDIMDAADQLVQDASPAPSPTRTQSQTPTATPTSASPTPTPTQSSSPTPQQSSQSASPGTTVSIGGIGPR